MKEKTGSDNASLLAPSPADSTRGTRYLGQVILKLRKLERQPRSFGAAGLLTPSEIHTIEAIGCGRSVLMSELAARLQVTKGAVTQLIARLEGKGLVHRTPHPVDSRATELALTELGVIAYDAHEETQRQFYQELLEVLTEDEIAVFEISMKKLSQFLDRESNSG